MERLIDRLKKATNTHSPTTSDIQVSSEYTKSESKYLERWNSVCIIHF